MQDSRRVGRDATRSRNRQGLVGAGLVGLIAAALIVGPHWFGGNPDSNSVTNPADAESTPAGAAQTSTADTVSIDSYAKPCPATPLAVSASPQADKALTTDVVMVRLCRAKVGAVTSAFQAPAEGLVAEVDVFLARVAKLPQAPVSPCPRVRLSPAPFALQITDSAGSTRTLSSPLTHCGTITINRHRVAADAVLGLFREALRQQR